MTYQTLLSEDSTLKLAPDQQATAWRYRCPGDLQWQYTERRDVLAHGGYEIQALTVQLEGHKQVPIEPTEEMIKAYLTANTAYWERTDNIIRPPGRWRTGRPTEATFEGYQAMIAAAPIPY